MYPQTLTVARLAANLKITRYLCLKNDIDIPRTYPPTLTGTSSKPKNNPRITPVWPSMPYMAQVAKVGSSTGITCDVAPHSNLNLTYIQ